MSDTTSANLRTRLSDIAEDIADERHHRTLMADYGPIDAGGYADRMMTAVREVLTSEAAVEAMLDAASDRFYLVVFEKDEVNVDERVRQGREVLQSALDAAITNGGRDDG